MLIPNKHSGYQAGIRLYPGGRGGSPAPPPDPKLIAAQIKSMGFQDAAIEQMMKNSADMAPIQKEQLQFGLDSARTAYGQAQDDRGWMLGKRSQLSGVQDTMLADAAAFNTEDKANELAGKATADVNQGFANAKGQADRSMARQGVNPSSGRALAMANQMSISQASALASAGTSARAGARAEGRALTDRASNALAGYPAMGMQATGNGANFGTAGSGLANAGLAGMNSGYGSASTAAGQMGSNATSMYGAQGSYSNTANQIANQPDPMMQMLGAVGGSLLKSDIRSKTKINGLRPGEALAKVNTIPVSEWQYKQGDSADDGGQRHTGPMAQDVQRVAGDAAAPGGTSIDLITLNGLNMAATQDLSQQVQALKDVVNKLAIRGGIKKEAAHG